MNIRESLAFTDSQRAALPGPFPAEPLVMIHGSHCAENPNLTLQEPVTPETAYDRLVYHYAQQLGVDSDNFGEYYGRVVLDYEIHHREPTTIDKLVSALTTAVDSYRTHLHGAQFAVFGHPAVHLWDQATNVRREIEPWELAGLWEKVDFVLYQDYSALRTWNAGQRNRQAIDIAKAHQTELPVYSAICPKTVAGPREWIQLDAVLSRASGARRLGARGLVYWDSLNHGEMTAEQNYVHWTTHLYRLQRLFASC